MDNEGVQCICGVARAAEGAPTHAYVPATPGCWQLFGEIQADESLRFGYPPRAHKTVVDAYMASHPGDGKDRREAQSVVVHLVGICGLLEFNWDPEQSRSAMRTLLAKRGGQLPVIRPWSRPSALTVQSMVGAYDLPDYEQRALAWANDVWDAWVNEHATIRSLLPESQDWGRRQ